jgi:uncharacterized membrane protein
MLSVYPGNSWYEILYMQRTYQPPAYFMLLWQWTKIMGHTEYAARLLSVVGGLMAVILTALLGRKLKNNQFGLLLAVMVAFNPTQLLYSLEARFYIFAYCMAVISLWMYSHVRENREASIFSFLFWGVINATLCYFHQFGLFFVFGLFVFDLYYFFRNHDRLLFYKKASSYILAGLLYAPWVFWGLIESLKVKEFWLKEINLFQYLTFSLGYPLWINVLMLGLILFYLISSSKKYAKQPFLLIISSVTLLPLIYSFIKFPILVDRYGMVMAPAIYILLAYALFQLTSKSFILRYRPYIWVIVIIILIIPGIYLTWFNKDKLIKQPWREMSVWLKKQSDYTQTDIYALGFYLKNRFTLDFYLLPEYKTKHLKDLAVGIPPKMYLVETNSVWKIKPELLHEVNEKYKVRIVKFNEGHSEFGNIYVCTKK